MAEKRDPLDTFIEKAEEIRPTCPVEVIEDAWTKFTNWFIKITPEWLILPPEGVEGECTPGESDKCFNSNLYRCSASGKWVLLQKDSPQCMVPTAGNMHGRVRTDSTPIVDRYVDIGGYRSAEVTNSFGFFAVEGIPAGYYETLSVEGYELYTLAIELRAGESKSLGIINLTPLTGPPPATGKLNVYITDANTHSPIGGLLVSLDGIQRHTDVSGYCVFSNLVEGTYWMSVTDPLNRYEPNPSVVPEGIPMPGIERLDIELTPLPVGPPPPPVTFEPTFVPLTCARFPVTGGTHEITSVIESLYEHTEWPGFSTLQKAIDSYVSQYKPTGLAEGPAYFYKWDDPEGGNTVHGYDLFGHEFEGRVPYPPTPASGIKLVVPALSGKSWTCYLDINGPYMFSSDWFINLLTVSGSGSTIKVTPTCADYEKVRSAGSIAMLRLEFDSERWVVACPVAFGIGGLARGWSIPDGMNFEWYIADLLTENQLAHFKYGLCKSKLTELYNKYNYWWGNIPHVDTEDGEEAGRMLLDKPPGWSFWSDWYCTYTLAEVAAAYNSKIGAADTFYNRMKAFYEGLKDKYEQNLSDP